MSRCHECRMPRKDDTCEWCWAKASDQYVGVEDKAGAYICTDVESTLAYLMMEYAKKGSS